MNQFNIHRKLPFSFIMQTFFPELKNLILNIPSVNYSDIRCADLSEDVCWLCILCAQKATQSLNFAIGLKFYSYSIFVGLLHLTPFVHKIYAGVMHSLVIKDVTARWPSNSILWSLILRNFKSE